MEHVRVDRHDRVALVTLVDRERRNAMTATMVDEIVETFDALEADDDIGAVVLTGEPPAFCSGADVAALGSLVASAKTTASGARSRSIYEGFLRVLRSPLPTVAAVNGPAVGAGLQPRARVRRAPRRRSRPASTPGSCASACTRAAATRGCSSARSARRPRPRWCCSASASTAPRAVEIGLAWACHPDDELIEQAIAFAARAASVPKELSAAAIATLREAPWQPDFDTAGRDRDHPPVVVTRSRLVSTPIDLLTLCVPLPVRSTTGGVCRIARLMEERMVGMETLRCPTCVALLLDPDARRCPACHTKLRKRRRPSDRAR